MSHPRYFFLFQWCQNQTCVERSPSPAPLDGGWSEWSEWSECSRTCGAGVSTQSRECNNPAPNNNGAYCIGDRSRLVPPRYSISNHTIRSKFSSVTNWEIVWTLQNQIQECNGRLLHWRQESLSVPIKIRRLGPLTFVHFLVNPLPASARNIFEFRPKRLFCRHVGKTILIFYRRWSLWVLEKTNLDTIVLRRHEVAVLNKLSYVTKLFTNSLPFSDTECATRIRALSTSRRLERCNALSTTTFRTRTKLSLNGYRISTKVCILIMAYLQSLKCPLL